MLAGTTGDQDVNIVWRPAQIEVVIHRFVAAVQPKILLVLCRHAGHVDGRRLVEFLLNIRDCPTVTMDGLRMFWPKDNRVRSIGV